MARKRNDVADSLLDMGEPEPTAGAKWAAELESAVRLLKDAGYQLRRLADVAPADDLPAVLRALVALDVRPSLIDATGDARNTGAGCAGMLSGQLADAFGRLGTACIRAVDAALVAGQNDDRDPIIRVADFAHVLLMSTAGSVPWLFAPETAFPAGSPLKSLPTLYLSGGQRVACVGVKGRQFVRLSEVRAWTEELEHQRARKAEDEARERRLRDEYAKQVDEQVDNVFLRRRVQELEAKLANQ